MNHLEKKMHNKSGQPFTIIPVIDIQNQQAVGTRLGSNYEYLPLKSKIANSVPLDIIRVYKKDFQFKQIYIADLDRIIENESDNDEILRLICDLPDMTVLLDIGLQSRFQFRVLDELLPDSVIISTETIKKIDTIDKALEHFGPTKVIVSLDIQNDKLISRNDAVSSSNVVEFAKGLEEKGVKRFILLDLSKIGSKLGEISDIFIQIRKAVSVEIFVAGGIGHIDHIKRLMELDFNGVLLASSLHEQLIIPSNLEDL